MSLDVLLEAADVLEKQKVASILTSMRDLDTYQHHHTSSQHTIYDSVYEADSHIEAGPSALVISDPSANHSSPLFNGSRRRPPAKLSGTFSILKRSRQSGNFNESSKINNISLTSDGDKSPTTPAKELYTFKEGLDQHEHRLNRGSSSSGGTETWHTRSIHNQMEKNRRAQLRVYMNNLRDVIPSGPNRRKLTTLTLLQNARAYIESLKEHEEEYEHDKQKLWRRHLRLREFLCQLNGSTVLTVPGIPTTPGIRKYIDPQTMDTSDDGGVLESDLLLDLPEDDTEGCAAGPAPRDEGARDDLSDESDSIGTFSNSDGGEISPDKVL